MSDIIDAADRFGSPRRASPKPSALDELRKTKRVALADRALLASRLGEIASRLSPGRPSEVAKTWFDQAWSGDRWAKRKRFICFPGEVAPDARDEGAYVASGSDWAALIDLAANSHYPGVGSTAEAERARLCRDVMRGTAFLPALNAVPLRAESAQSLMAMLVEKIVDRIDSDTDLRRLWEVLDTTPFNVESCDLERPIRSELPDGEMFDTLFAGKKYVGDSYSTGPLGAAAARAIEVARFRYRPARHQGYRFEPCTSGYELSWPYPVVRLGLRGHSRTGRIFELPPNFAKEIRPSFDPDEEASDDLALEWLVKKGVMAGTPFEPLPNIPFEASRGYGWREFSYELVQSIRLEVQPKADGTPGLWVSAWIYDLSHYYPKLRGFDPLATEAQACDSEISFLGMSAGYHTSLEFVEWPAHRPDFMPNGEMPVGAVSGLIEPADEEHVTIEGWIDDLENVELQNLLFRNEEGVRFSPSITVEHDLPPPCRPATVAAAIFTNASGETQHRLGLVLVHQARAISSAGLAFHEALLGHHRSAIDRMLTDRSL